MKLILTNKPIRIDRISQPFKSTHKGIDLVDKRGTKAPVYATADGVVVAASNGAWDWSYGNMVAIYHGSGNYTNHAHLSSIKVKVGKKVKAGDLIGYQGSTGRSTGNHLHFEIHLGKKWDRVNPEPYLDVAAKPVKYIVSTKKNPLNLRAKPEAGAKIVGKVGKGKVVTGTKSKGNYIFLPYLDGWASRTYLRKKV